MSTSVAVLWAATASAVFAYLSTRAASYLWGRPPLDPRVLRALGREPPRFAHPVRNVDVWILVALLGVTEVGIGTSLSDAIAVRDGLQTILYVTHFAFAACWLLYLWTRYAGGQGQARP